MNQRGTAMWAATAVLVLASPAARAEGRLNVICSVQAGWCQTIQAVFAKTTCIPVPRRWADLLNPVCQGEIQVGSPSTSGTAYVMIATLVQLMGEDAAFAYLKELHRNIGAYTRSGTAPIKAVARGEAAVSIGFVHDGPQEKMQGFPVETVTPGEGTGAEIGSMSIVKGARHLDEAKRFYEWALTPQAQQLGAASKQYQLPSNKNAVVDPNVPDVSRIRLVRYDYARYGSSAERRRLVARWEREVGASSK